MLDKSDRLPLVKPFGKTIALMVDLRSPLHNEVAEEVEAIAFPSVTFDSAEVSGET